eukprot:Hpha_TRINITY_DN15810_c2_g2::TRINITY_DN15810_c2_g2_i1::g.191344::m.191344
MPGVDYSKWDALDVSDDEEEAEEELPPRKEPGLELRKLKAAVEDLQAVVGRGPLPSSPEEAAAILERDIQPPAASAAAGGAAAHALHSDPCAAPAPCFAVVEAMQDDPEGGFAAGARGIGTFREPPRRRAAAQKEIVIRWPSGASSVSAWPNEMWYRLVTPAEGAPDAAGLAVRMNETLRQRGSLTTAELYSIFQAEIGDGPDKIDRELFRAALHSSACFRKQMKLWEAQELPLPSGSDHCNADDSPPALITDGDEGKEAVVRRKGDRLDYSKWDRIVAEELDGDEGRTAVVARKTAQQPQGDMQRQLQELLQVKQGLAQIQERRKERLQKIAEIDAKYGFTDE